MTIKEIIKAVRWSIDDETRTEAAIADNGDDVYTDNIIRSKINDALHWLSVTAPSSAILTDPEKAQQTSTTDDSLKIESYDDDLNIGKITLPASVDVLSVVRVRCEGWYKGVAPVDDTEDDALMMFDDTAAGTKDRPQAVLMRESPAVLLVQPKGDKATVSYVSVPNNADVSESTDESTDVSIPKGMRGAFVYYIAYLLLTAFGDARSQTMLQVAYNELGVTTSSS